MFIKDAMKMTFQYIFLLIVVTTSLVSCNCPPGAVGFKRENKLVCIETSKVTRKDVLLKPSPLVLSRHHEFLKIFYSFQYFM